MAIDPRETGGDLLARLGRIGAEELVAALERLATDTAEPVDQRDEGAVYAPRLTRSLSPVRWDRDVVTVHNQIRALDPFPGTTSYLADQPLKLGRAEPGRPPCHGLAPGHRARRRRRGRGRGLRHRQPASALAAGARPPHAAGGGFPARLLGRGRPGLHLVSVDPRRRAALRALLAVGRGQDPEDAVTRAVAREEDRRAGRAVDELVRGVIQWRDRYAHLVEHFSRRGANRDPVARAVLAIALHELLLHEGTPAYASIHQAGELLRAEGKARLVGYVNGVLQAVRRHVERQGAGPLPVLRPLFDDPDPVATALARWWSHPHWLVARWLERFGHDDTEALLAHQNRRPPVTLHVLPGADVAATRARLAEAGLPTNLRSGFPRALELSGRAERPSRRRARAAAGRAGAGCCGPGPDRLADP